MSARPRRRQYAPRRADRSFPYNDKQPARHTGTRKLVDFVRSGRFNTCYHSRNRQMTDANGGARRDRTDDLMLAKHALSQLSYGPVADVWWAEEDLNLRPHAYQACALTT